eukprot:2861381-Rhodomonas_salina.2
MCEIAGTCRPQRHRRDQVRVTRIRTIRRSRADKLPTRCADHTFRSNCARRAVDDTVMPWRGWNGTRLAWIARGG